MVKIILKLKMGKVVKKMLEVGGGGRVKWLWEAGCRTKMKREEGGCTPVSPLYACISGGGEYFLISSQMSSINPL